VTFYGRLVRVGPSLGLIAAGIVLLVVGGNVLLRGAVSLAHLIGLSERVIGLTVVSMGTGLPEVAASLAAARRGQSEMALGNVIGSNIMNVFGVLGAVAWIHPLDVNVAEVMHIIGDVEGQDCLIVDDLIDTAGTLVKAGEALLQQGAKSVRASATHAVLSGPAVERIEQSDITEVVVTNSIPLRGPADNCTRIKQLSVAPMLAKAIQSIHEDGSVSTLFV